MRMGLVRYGNGTCTVWEWVYIHTGAVVGEGYVVCAGCNVVAIGLQIRPHIEIIDPELRVLKCRREE